LQRVRAAGTRATLSDLETNVTAIVCMRNLALRAAKIISKKAGLSTFCIYVSNLRVRHMTPDQQHSKFLPFDIKTDGIVGFGSNLRTNMSSLAEVKKNKTRIYCKVYKCAAQ
jgi:hypothetical protein